ncbi:MAG: indole-3-glycerol phosphate synthase TrpC [Myxococcota bacterium]
MTILDEILDHKRGEVADAKRLIGAADLARLAESCTEPVRGFRRGLAVGDRPRVIAEIKRRSPSKGEIRTDFDPVLCAKAYEEAGAAAISVLTDAHYFGGDLGYLQLVRDTVSLPILRKEFIVDVYQIDESRCRGADAVLLIVSAFPGDNAVAELMQLRQRATELGLDTLMEITNESELDTALECGADLLGVNNRDLRTFEVDLAVSERLCARAPASALLVAESGISEPRDIARLESAGAQAFLVGEALMKEPDIGAALRRLRRTL